MGRRTLSKRISRQIEQFKKKLVKKSNNVLGKYEKWTVSFAGPEISEKMKCCQTGEFCQCQAARDVLLKTYLACSPQRVERFKEEFAYFQEEFTKGPGEWTVRDFRKWPILFLGMFVFFYLGMSIGRWNLWGFRYDNEQLE